MTGRPGARWEFRCWPPADLASGIAVRLDTAADWQRLPDERRTDTYFLPPDHPDLMPKLRGGERFEVKWRLEVRDELERWELALSENWPLDAEARQRTKGLFKDHAAALSTGTDALAALGWTVEQVGKKRQRWERDEMMLEVTDTSLGWTVAWEGQDRGTLRASVDGLGLAGLPNRSYRWRIENTG